MAPPPPVSRRKLIVVFGAAVRPDGSPSPTLARRVGYAYAEAARDPSTDLFLSGAEGRYPPSEAAVMAAMLRDQISAERLILDEDSGDTLQSVRAAAAYARDHGYVECLSATDGYHQPRVVMLFRLHGVRCRPIAFAHRGAKRLRWRMGLREVAAVPYDLVAGIGSALRKR